MPHLIVNIFMIMFKEILDKFDSVMINHVKSLECSFHKTTKWKSVAIEGGKACSRSEEKSDFNNAVGR